MSFMDSRDGTSKGILDFNSSLHTIPAGTQLFSKRPELFSPERWPTYYVRAKGINLWDNYGKKYSDMSQMGVGSCILGYAFKPVDRAVGEIIRRGVQSTLIATQEMELAQELLEIHKWAEMARFARSGGEAMSIAVRVARVATGKDKVFFSGYHGWNDWYLAANLADEDQLQNVLLPGLSAQGVPVGLAGSAIPFEFNNLEMFEELFQKHMGSVAAIVMEPRRSEPANPGFLERIRKLCDENSIVLIFDEITTGWRGNVGGIHLQGTVTPDLAVFAKSMSNGYAMSAVIGTESVMSAASSTFISSTNWTERVGPTAALATIRNYAKNDVDKHILNIGDLVQKGWIDCAASASINVSVNTKGLPSLSSFSFNYPFARGLNIEFTNRMLDRGWLAHNQFKPSYAHKERIVEKYLNDVLTVFEELSYLISTSEDLLTQKSNKYPAPSIPRLTR
ncbi:HemL Glutamate-1-semialdehyde aminotransferase [Candidatus Nanopelagicaceae bacterium]